MAKIPAIFEKDSNGMAIPKLANGVGQWLFSGRYSIKVVYMLDGLEVRVKQTGINPIVQRRIDCNGVRAWVACDRNTAEDNLIWQAFDKEKPYKTGTYVIIGPLIYGNPHKVSVMTMTRVEPDVDYQILIGSTQHAIPLLPSTKIEDFYEGIKKELSTADCDVPGLIIVDEAWNMGQCNITNWAKVERKDFGLPWPIPVEAPLPLATIVGPEPALCIRCHAMIGGTTKGLCQLCVKDQIEITSEGWVGGYSG